MNRLHDIFFQGLVSDRSLARERKARRKQYVFESVPYTFIVDILWKGPRLNEQLN